MQLFSSEDNFYALQEAWNNLEPHEALAADQYVLADMTGIDASQWRDFLRDGNVAKYIDSELELIKKAQMRDLIFKATTNDKSVGTAQMINAISKTMEDDSAETNFYIYSHVPLNEAECEADFVREEETWRPPTVVKEITQAEAEAQKVVGTSSKPLASAVQPEPSNELTEDDW